MMLLPPHLQAKTRLYIVAGLHPKHRLLQRIMFTPPPRHYLGQSDSSSPGWVHLDGV